MAGGNDTTPRYNAATHKKLVEGEKRGLFNGKTADLAGIARVTYLKWLRKGKQAVEDMEAGRDPGANAKYAQLFLDVSRARAQWEISTLEAIDDVDETQWQKHAWKLERKLPEEYSLQTRQHVEVEQPLVNVNVLADGEALRALDQALRALTGGSGRELPPGDDVIDGELAGDGS